MIPFRPLALALACTLATPAFAAGFDDPTWPCVQRKVERLSLGLMWPAPVAEPDTAARAEVEELAGLLALRRLDPESLTPQITAFARAHEGDPEAMGQVFAQVFARLSTRRTRIIEGIGEFSLGQIALADRIDATRAEMDKLLAADDPDFDRVDALEEQLDWDQLIYSDRQKSITYLCETPVLLEKRLYAVAKLLQEAGQDGG